VECGPVAHGEFVVSRRDGAVAFEPVDTALHGVALLVDVRVEARGSSALRSLLAAIRGLIGLDRDGRLDPTSTQVVAVGVGGVGLVCQDPVGSGAGPTVTQATTSAYA
jgi:hypothetical protein